MFPAKKWRVCTLNNGQKEKPAAVHQSKVSFLGRNYTLVQHTIVSGKNVEFGHKFNLESCFFRSLESGKWKQIGCSSCFSKMLDISDISCLGFLQYTV